MPPKKEVAPVNEPPAEIDPAVLAQQSEDRKLFERGEMIARQRVEAMEQIGWKCVLNEKEKRLDPAGWADKTSLKGPTFIFVKTLTGNRAVPQMNVRLFIKNLSITLRDLKEAIQTEFAKQMNNPAAAAWFAPSHQILNLNGGKINCDDEYNTLVKAAGISHGCTIHLYLVQVPVKDLLPAVIAGKEKK